MEKSALDYSSINKAESVLNIRVINVQEFKNLLERAQKEAHQLKNTLDELESFEIKVEFKQ